MSFSIFNSYFPAFSEISIELFISKFLKFTVDFEALKSNFNSFPFKYSIFINIFVAFSLLENRFSKFNICEFKFIIEADRSRSKLLLKNSLIYKFKEDALPLR